MNPPNDNQLPVTSQQPALPETTPKNSTAKRSRPALRLTERDYALFKFLLDQKFASLEALFFKFFDPRKNPTDPLPKNLAVARQRLGILKRAGLLQTERVYSEAKNLYLLSKLGWKCLRDKYPELIYAPSALTVDFRNYEHDARVTNIRIALEKTGKARKWYPERRIRIQGFTVKGMGCSLPDTIVPDGIYLTPKGERIAIELEVAVRKKSRFSFKLAEYENVMEGPEPLIHKVLFIAASDAVGKDLAETIKGRPGFILRPYLLFHQTLFSEPVISEAQRLQDHLIEAPVDFKEEE